MIRSLFTRRGAAAFAAATIGLTGMSLAFAALLDDDGDRPE